MPAQTQDDLVREAMGYRPKETTRKINLPGLQSLHLKSGVEIAEALALVLKAESNIVEIKYRLGEYIEVTTQPAR